MQTKSLVNSESQVSSINFHGTRMDNIYSCLHIGLLTHLSKNALFGEGTYLSKDPTVSLHYSPSGKTWENSIIGQRMSCLLVCETINDPKYVKTGLNDVKMTQNSNGGASLDSNNNNANQENTSNKIPEMYFIVKNNDYVRIKYILVYAEKAKVKRKNKLVQFIQDNKFALLLVTYSLLLIFIGLLNSRTFHKYMKLSMKTLSNFILGGADEFYHSDHNKF
jgi:poly[ADP-ribose] polymerase 16